MRMRVRLDLCRSRSWFGMQGVLHSFPQAKGDGPISKCPLCDAFLLPACNVSC